MKIQKAYLYTQIRYPYDKKIAGLYPLERLIKFLKNKGFYEIYLNLSEKEGLFYNQKIAKHLKKLEGLKIILNEMISPNTPFLKIPTNIFLEPKQLNSFNDYFSGPKNIFTPIEKKFLFFKTKDDLSKGEKILKNQITSNTSGFIAREINKKISLPISFFLTKTRLHPNYLTIVNMLIGLWASISLFISAKSLQNKYLWHLSGGFFFQLASILDGVDGEVAKLTLTTSKLGSWLDTLSDNLTLFLFLSAASYLNYLQIDPKLSLAFIIIMFSGLFLMIYAMVSYLRNYSQSGSLVAYDKEFLQKLPLNNPLVKFIHRVKYITKKEFFSILFFFICSAGLISYLIPLVSIVVFISAIILILINKRYLKTFKNF